MQRTFAAIAEAGAAKESGLPKGAPSALEAASDASNPQASGYVSLEVLTSESNELRRALIAFMEALEELPSGTRAVEQMRDEAVACSKRIVERELLLFPQVYGAPPVRAPAASKE